MVEIKKWKAWAQDKKDNKFLFLCPLHLPLVQRKVDAVGNVMQKSAKCDFPECKRKATSEYFPNLIKLLKKRSGTYVSALRSS